MKDDVADAFGELLSIARHEAGLSQEELGSLTGLDRTAISKLERGINSPTLKTMIHLAGALEIEPSKLVPAVRWRPRPSAKAPAGELVRE